MKVSPPVSGRTAISRSVEADLEPAGGLDVKHPAPVGDGGVEIVDDDGHLAQLHGAGLVGGGLPIGSGGGPGVGRVGDFDDFEEGAVAGRGMDEGGTALIAMGSGMFRFAGDADAEVAQVGDEPVVLIGLEDHEVGGFAATLEEAGAGGGIVGGSEDLDEGAVAGGLHRVVQAELRESASAAGLHAQDATVEVDAPRTGC